MYSLATTNTIPNLFRLIKAWQDDGSSWNIQARPVTQLCYILPCGDLSLNSELKTFWITGISFKGGSWRFCNQFDSTLDFEGHTRMVQMTRTDHDALKLFILSNHSDLLRLNFWSQSEISKSLEPRSCDGSSLFCAMLKLLKDTEIFWTSP
ncbi:unnamed protein product [Caenorhabditis brenneri]